jgi:putative FmdB family regulatory protein
MPLYEYDCPAHGVFEAVRGISEYAEPAPCPDCSLSSPRILSLPRLSGMARSEVVARDRNERSRHEPRVSQSPAAPGGAQRRSHGDRGAGRNPSARPLVSYQGARPWVIEHG